MSRTKEQKQICRYTVRENESRAASGVHQCLTLQSSPGGDSQEGEQHLKTFSNVFVTIWEDLYSFTYICIDLIMVLFAC